MPYVILKYPNMDRRATEVEESYSLGSMPI